GGKQLFMGTGVQTAAVTFPNEPKTDGSQSYMFFVSNFLNAGQWVQTVRIGYEAPPKAFVANSPIPRVLDTRSAIGVPPGKVPAGGEIVVLLFTPATASAAVINLTVTETENSGFLAVFPANVPWPGNSSINWSASNQNIANTVVTATDTQGAIRV